MFLSPPCSLEINRPRRQKDLLVVGRLGTTTPGANTTLETDVVGSNELLVDLLDGLEVVDGLDVELEGGVLVADDHAAGVELDGRDGPHVVDTLLDALGQGQGLVGTSDDNADLAGIHDSAIVVRKRLEKSYG